MLALLFGIFSFLILDLSTPTLSSNLISKLAYSLVQAFLGIQDPNNSIHALLIWHNSCSFLDLDYITIQSLRIYQLSSSPAPVFLARILFIFLASHRATSHFWSHSCKLPLPYTWSAPHLSADRQRYCQHSVVFDHGCQLDFCNALYYGMLQKKLQLCATSPELSCQNCVQCAISLLIPAITQIVTFYYQSLSVLNLPLWRTKFDYTSSHLNFSHTSQNINLLALCIHQILTYLQLHLLNSKSSQCFQHLRHNCVK